jgi:hypothetical protein
MKILCSNSEFFNEISKNATKIAYIIDTNGIQEGRKDLKFLIAKSIRMAFIGDDIFFNASFISQKAIDDNNLAFFAEPHTKSEIQNFVKSNLL